MSDSSSSRAKDLTAEEWGTNASAAPETLLRPGSSNTGSSRFVYGVRVLQPAGRDACFPQGTTCASQRRGPYRGWSLCISKVTLWNSRIWVLEGTFQPVSLDPLSLQMLRLRLREGKCQVVPQGRGQGTALGLAPGGPDPSPCSPLSPAGNEHQARG